MATVAVYRPPRTRPARPAGGPAPKARPSPLQTRRRRLFYPFVLPALVLYLIFYIGPTLGAVWISFTKWRGSGPMEWRGLRNYKVLIQDPVFHTAFKNTLIMLVLVGAAVFALSFALTMLLRGMRGGRLVRSIVFFPYIVSAIVLSIIWGFLFQYNGLVNNVITVFGGPHVKFLAVDNLFKMILLGLVWMHMGLYSTIIMAGVDRIPASFYEDSALGGANAFQRFRHVTLPMTWDVVSVAAVLWTINSLKIFEFIYAFGGTTNSTPAQSVWNSALFVYGESFGGGTPSYLFGYASACAMLMLALFAIFVLLLRRLFRREAIQF